MQLKYSKSSQQLIAHRLLVCRRSHPHCRMLLTRGCLGTKGRDLVSQLCMAQSYWTENTRLFGENTLPPSACFCLSPPLHWVFSISSRLLLSTKWETEWIIQGITSLSTECQKYHLSHAVTLFHSFVCCIIHITRRRRRWGGGRDISHFQSF